MIPEFDTEAQQYFRRATKEVLLPPASAPPILESSDIQATLPHRDPFLFLNRILVLDLTGRTMIAEFDLNRARILLNSHFPGQPIFPGVLQLEAIAQAGLLFFRRTHWEEGNTRARSPIWLTHVYEARFMNPVVPGAPLTISIRLLDSGLLHTVIGQCSQAAKICSAAAIASLMD